VKVVKNLVIWLSLFLYGCAHSEQHLTISAAASLQGPLEEVVEAFEAEHPSVRININYGGSGALKHQVEEGAPVDLFFSAGMSQMEALVESGYIKEWTTVVENRLVLVVPDQLGQDIKQVEDLSKSIVQKIAIGQPETVPAGQYAKEVLDHLHLWDTVQEKIVYGKDVRHVYTYVTTNNVEAGFVYKTDVQSKDLVQVIPIPSEFHSPIVYPIGIVANTKQRDEANRFIEFIQEEQAKFIFEKYDFSERNSSGS